MGTNGITPDRGLTTSDLAEAQVKRSLIRAARRTVVLADHSKFGREEFAHVAGLDDVDLVITDSDLAGEMADEITAAGPRIELA